MTYEAAAARRAEWAMMYAAGLTPKQIANACGAGYPNVNYHLRVARAEDPGLEARHKAKLSPIDGLRPSEVSALEDLARFQREYGRLPISTDTFPDTARLYRWLWLRRQYQHEGKLSPKLKARLDLLGDWDVVYGERRREATWRSNLDELVTWRTENNGRWPMWKNPADETEKRLGVWLHYQRYRSEKYPLREIRRQLLEKLAPGWDELRESRRWAHLSETKK